MVIHLKIKKEYLFKPVTIIFETEEEVNYFWDAIENVMNDESLSINQKRILINISDEFTSLNVV